MKFLIWFALLVIGSFFDWMVFFGGFFLYDEASHRKAEIGFTVSASDGAALIVLPVLVNIVIAIASVFLTAVIADDLHGHRPGCGVPAY